MHRILAYKKPSLDQHFRKEIPHLHSSLTPASFIALTLTSESTLVSLSEAGVHLHLTAFVAATVRVTAHNVC